MRKAAVIIPIILLVAAGYFYYAALTTLKFDLEGAKVKSGTGLSCRSRKKGEAVF